MAVTLINVFSVPQGKEEEFVKWWQDVKGDITKQPGFKSGTFHRSLKPDSKFNFINVAMWENETLYWTAYEKSVTPMKAKLEQLGVQMVPALYKVVLEY
jgi:heme-degrading monooxygenase HmoA